MSFRFHPEAAHELREAVEYYEDIDPGLGYDFSVEVYSAIQRAVAYPLAWPVLVGDVRRALVRRFPYGVLYSEEEDTLLIVAVMNLHREPGYWKGRR
ncbi:type II toxin-antitoxin system RelE/ParE family toxin [Halomonas campisalis]|uniref:Type II toxin-antitoxin system RelE/ParE family toxin n=1 Tax=Billgrantia campisalis TaxID=74661 RepID=A0ABS9PCX1_9GAMM|nr:type II toxin-antitoxin system RelE/ParE family toxin [Halomonas campisalis]MCG6659619.1 type II toxin-antitoxin system RelE/ParE family toxin [Halomonas campisalis]MDR5864580.1 type II toxin-antitoxin system RelE/ParE family toxin [Halomonas campisalis]